MLNSSWRVVVFDKLFILLHSSCFFFWPSFFSSSLTYFIFDYWMRLSMIELVKLTIFFFNSLLFFFSWLHFLIVELIDFVVMPPLMFNKLGLVMRFDIVFLFLKKLTYFLIIFFILFLFLLLCTDMITNRSLVFL